MAALSPAVSLWVKSEPFTTGALPIPPHPRLTTHNIKRIVSYAKNKGRSGFPQLSYAVWRHIACNKLLIPEDHAWMYFTTFDLLQPTSPEHRIELDRRLSRCTSGSEIESVRCQLTVPTLQFVLFLHIQHLHKISLRASLVSASDEWPSRARSPSSDLEGRSTPTGGASKTLDDHAHMMFVLNHLSDIMELLVESDTYSGVPGSSDVSLSIEAVEALDFLLAGSVDGNRNVKPVHEIALMHQVHQKSGYSKVNVETSRSTKGWKLVISRSFSFRNLQSWLRCHITQNPFGVSSCISQGKRLSWPLAGEDKESRADSKRGRIATNALFVPRSKTKGNKLIVMSQVNRQTVARSSGTLEGSTMKIHRCHYSFLYLLSPLRSATIEKCRNSTILLGAVETSVHLSHCENVTIIAACRRLDVSNCSSCTFHLMTPYRPLVFSSNEALTFAPYHTYYGHLQVHMMRVGLGWHRSLWDQPLCVGPDSGQEETAVWQLMNPRDFYIFSVPFETEGETKCIPWSLPSRYQKALTSKERQIELWQKMVKDAGLAKDHKRHFQSVVEAHFQEWLSETGHKRQLDGLAPSTSSKTK